MKKELLFLSAIIFAPIFFMGMAKKASAASACDSIIINPGIVTENNTIVIQDNRILDQNLYNIQIFVGTGHRISNIEAEGQTVQATIEFKNFILPPGNIRVLLEHANKTNICESKINVQLPRDCRWTVNPQNPWANHKMEITLNSSIINKFPSKYSIKLRELNGDIKSISGAQGRLAYTPSKKGNYQLFLELILGRAEGLEYPQSFRVCSAVINVGESSQNPGDGITDKEDAIPPETDTTKKLCQEEVGPCTDCFNAGKTWTALGCIPTNDLNEFAGWVFGKVIFIASGIAFLLMAFGAFQIITSAGDPKKTQAGSELITSALSGLIFIILSIFLLKLIGVDILHIPGFSTDVSWF